ncbi:MAG: fibronectin type III domain-containing protein, partial [Thermoplasmata archaeon]|nr:fibronectin type III domain-containing protein [Thermoplasmata archaeon]
MDRVGGHYIVHNYFIKNRGSSSQREGSSSRGVIGNCQGWTNVGDNIWYNTTIKGGNYWSNWDGSGWGTATAYPLDGGGGASDWYPLSPPSPPQNLSAESGNKYVRLRWEPPSYSGGIWITNYRIYRNGSLVVTLDNVTEYTDTGLANGVTYRYKVSAVNSVG